MRRSPDRADPDRRRRAVAQAEHRIRLLATLADALAGLGMVEEALEASKEIARVRDELAPRLGAAPDPPRRRTVAPVET